MCRLMWGHWLKTKRTSVRMLCLLLPIIYSSLLFLYFLIREPVKGDVTNEFLAFFLFFSIASLFSLSILVPLLLSPDKEAGCFGNELRVGVSREKLFLSRFFLILLLVIFIEMCALLLFVGLQVIFHNSTIDFMTLFYFGLTPLGCLSIMIPIYQILALRFSYTGSLLVGVVFTLSAILMGTTDLGDGLWRFLPWIWSIRLTYDHVPRIVLGEAIAAEYWSLLAVALLLSVVLIFVGIFWYNRWEGMASLEE